MTAPAGWYPDPASPVPGAPAQQRYWDGQGWTAHVAPISLPQAHQQPTYPQARYGEPGYPAQAPSGGSATTPDGVPLAGWWQRVGAYVIDGLISLVLVSIVGFPLLRDMASAFGDFIDAAVTAAQNGQPSPSSAELQREIAGPAVAFGAIGLTFSFIYTLVFLSWKQATPGKLALGLGVRLRESPELPLSAILVRWATQTGAPWVVGLVPFIGWLGSLFGVVDVLWPLWDDKLQALHDKTAKTNVVRTR
jgi:uncharacterized RDD family membrane protein YckC